MGILEIFLFGHFQYMYFILYFFTIIPAKSRTLDALRLWQFYAYYCCVLVFFIYVSYFGLHEIIVALYIKAKLQVPIGQKTNPIPAHINYTLWSHAANPGCWVVKVLAQKINSLSTHTCKKNHRKKPKQNNNNRQRSTFGCRARQMD